MRSIALAVFGLVLAGVAVVKADEAKTFKPDDDGFIRNWLVLDPIPVDDAVGNHNEETCKAMFDKEYFTGEKEATPKDGEKVTADGKELTWHALQAEDYSIDLSKAASDAGKQTEKALYIGVVYVTAEKETPEVTLAIGSDDDSMWRLNGQEAIRVYAGRAVDKDQDKSKPMTLKQGANILNFIVINGDGPAAACARFLDKDGGPIKGLTVSLTPPAK